jgi:hypothetical protein
MEGVRQAAGFEGFLILGIIYFILNLITKAGKKKEDAATGGTGASPAAEEDKGLSLEEILREIQRAKERAEQQQQGASRPTARPSARPSAGDILRQQRMEAAARRIQPQPTNERGPLGRQSRTRLPAAEEVEERDSLEGGSLEVEERIQNLDNRTRVLVDQDEQAEALVQRRIDQASARNTEHRSTDHRRFDKKVREAVPDIAPVIRYAPAQMRDAFIWRELLGPPKSMEE